MKVVSDGITQQYDRQLLLGISIISTPLQLSEMIECKTDWSLSSHHLQSIISLADTLLTFIFMYVLYFM